MRRTAGVLGSCPGGGFYHVLTSTMWDMNAPSCPRRPKPTALLHATASTARGCGATSPRGLPKGVPPLLHRAGSPGGARERRHGGAGARCAQQWSPGGLRSAQQWRADDDSGDDSPGESFVQLSAAGGACPRRHGHHLGRRPPGLRPLHDGVWGAAAARGVDGPMARTLAALHWRRAHAARDNAAGRGHGSARGGLGGDQPRPGQPLRADRRTRSSRAS